MKSLSVSIKTLNVYTNGSEPATALLTAFAVPVSIVGETASAANAPLGLEVQGDVVIDHRSGLMWTRENLPGGRMTLDDAIAAAKACRTGGYSDWEIPERPELLSLVDLKLHEPCVPKDVFPTCESAWYWSKTACAWNASYAWVVDFGSGGAGYYHRNYRAFARAVRRVSPSQ